MYSTRDKIKIRCQEVIIGDEFINMLMNKKIKHLSTISKFILSKNGTIELVLSGNDKSYLEYIDTLIEHRKETILKDFGVVSKQTEK